MSRDCFFVCLNKWRGTPGTQWKEMMGASKFQAIQYSPVTHKIVSTQRVSSNLNLQIKQSCKDCLYYFLHCHKLRELGLVYFMFSTLCVCLYAYLEGYACVWSYVCAHSSCGGEKATSGISQSSPFTLFKSEPLFFFRAMCLWLAG